MAKPSTAVATKKNGTALALPENAAEILKARAEALRKTLAAPRGNNIIVKNKMFQLTKESEATSEMKGIIVGVVSFNSYYENAFNEDTKAPPNCFAIGIGTNDTIVASTNSPDPQNADDGNQCETCWANEFGSGGAKKKACKNQKRLAILCADGELRTLTLSPTALTEFDKYFRAVEASHGSINNVMTTFYCDPQPTYSTIRCRNPLALNDEQLAAVISLFDEADAMLAREPDTAEFEEKVVALRAKSKSKLPASKARARV